MSEPTPTQPNAAPPAPPAPGRQRRFVLVLVLAGLFLAGGGYWWIHHGLEFTDDAQVDAEVLPVPSRVGGVVSEVRFEDNEPVKAGQVLAVIDDAIPKAKVDQCRAALTAALAAAEAAQADAAIATTNANSNLALANASLRTATVGSNTASNQIQEAEASLSAARAAHDQAERERDRVQRLFQSGAVSPAAFDQAQAASDVAEANLVAARARVATLRSSASQARSRIQEASAKVKQTEDVEAIVHQAQARAQVAQAQVQTAQAALAMAELELSYTRIVAPVDGVASKKTVLVGQNLAPGQPIAQLVTSGRWVVANFKETQLEHMQAGQPVRVAVDAYPSHALEGRVESFAGGTGSRFALLPPDNASGNFTKVVQRVPVRITLVDLPGEVQLRPGMSVELSVDTRSRTTASAAETERASN